MKIPTSRRSTTIDSCQLDSNPRDTLRHKYTQTGKLVLSTARHAVPLENAPIVRKSVGIRNTCVVPLNLLQVELFNMLRMEDDEKAMYALPVTINRIDTGVHNTG